MNYIFFELIILATICIKRSKIHYYWLYVRIHNARLSVRLFIAYWRLSQKWDASWWIINSWRERKIGMGYLIKVNGTSIKRGCQKNEDPSIGYYRTNRRG